MKLNHLTLKNLIKEILLEQEKEKSDKIKEYERKCNEGDLKACMKLGIAYDHGERGAEENDQKAHALYKKACHGGNMRGCDFLGMDYFFGTVTADNEQRDENKNYRLAEKYFTKSCESGRPFGCMQLGRFLEIHESTS